MSKKKEALGKGIRALLETIDDKPDLSSSTLGSKSDNKDFLLVKVDQIEVNPYQPRTEFDKQSLEELSQSIKVHGLIQPITVRKLGNKFQLISGERRVRASRLAKLKEVPAYVRTADDQGMLEMGLIENIQREDLNALEVAINYQRLIDECDLKQDELGERIGKNRSTISNYLRLLKLPPSIQIGIKDKKISMGHARAIVSIDDPISQTDIYNTIVQKGLSVRGTEQLVREYSESAAKSRKKSTTPSLPTEYKNIQNQLTSRLSTKVALKHKSNGRGEIVISYFSDDDLNRILELLDD